MTMMSSLYVKHGQLNLSLQGNAESASVVIVGDLNFPPSTGRLKNLFLIAPVGQRKTMNSVS